jgi:hypothetical protein
MAHYNCINCNYTTQRQGDYKKHLLTKKHLKLNQLQLVNTQHPVTPNNAPKDPIVPNNTPCQKKDVNNKDNNKTQCDYCSKYISTKHLSRHYIKSCMYIPDKIKCNFLVRHNNNGNTKNKLQLTLYNDNKKSIINNNNNNNNNINVVNNYILKTNPIGKESIDHISFERMAEILRSGNRMIKEYCKELHKIVENKNAYLDVRQKLIFYINSNNDIEIEHMNTMLSKIVDTYVNNINKFYKDNEDNFDNKTKQLFLDTYNTYFCVINLSNINDTDYIEEEHKVILKDYSDDMWLSLYRIKDSSKILTEGN